MSVNAADKSLEIMYTNQHVIVCTYFIVRLIHRLYSLQMWNSCLPKDDSQFVKQFDSLYMKLACTPCEADDVMKHPLKIHVFPSQMLLIKVTIIVTISADFQQGVESVSWFKMNTVTENCWLINAAATVMWPYHVGYYFQSLSQSKTSTPIPCPVDRDDIVPLSKKHVSKQISKIIFCHLKSGEVGLLTRMVD